MVMRIPAAPWGRVAARNLSCHPCSLVQDTFVKLLLGPTSRKGQVSAAQASPAPRLGAESMAVSPRWLWNLVKAHSSPLSWCILCVRGI